jgi:DNA-binding NarL/FixJ family response regulator
MVRHPSDVVPAVARLGLFAWSCFFPSIWPSLRNGELGSAKDGVLSVSRSQRRLVLIEDNPADARLIREFLADGSSGEILVVWANTVRSGLARLPDGPTDAVLLDLSLPDSQGPATFATVHEHAPSVPIVVLSGSIDDEVAFAAVRAGAQDYLVKGGIDGHLLVRALAYAIERKQHEETQRFLSDASRNLAASLDPDTTLRTVAAIAVPFLADCCIVDLVDEQQCPRRAAIVHRDPGREEDLRAYR